MRAQGSEVSTPRTVQTHMVQLPAGYGNCKFQSTAVFTFDLKDAPKALNFVLQDRNTGKWCVAEPLALTTRRPLCASSHMAVSNEELQLVGKH